MIPSENATNLMDCKEIKRNSVKRGNNKITHKRIRKASFFGHVMRREKLEHRVTTETIEGKRNRGKQREKMLDGLTEWLKVGRVAEVLKAARDRDAWKVMSPSLKSIAPD